MHRGLIGAGAACALAALCACNMAGAGAANPLLGKWSVVANGALECMPELEFKPASHITYSNGSTMTAPHASEEPAAYVVSGHQVFVDAPGAIEHTTAYEMEGPNRMLSPQGCSYERE